MSAVERKVRCITTLWGTFYSIDPAHYRHYESYVYAVTQSKALVREACEENGGLEEDDVDDTRKEIDKAVDKGICCTGIEFIKRQENKTHLYEGTRTHRSRGHLSKFNSHA